MHLIEILIPILVIVACLAFFVFLWWRIFKKTGNPGAMGLIVLLPGIGLLIVLCMLAFSKWPIETEVEQHRMSHGVMPPAPPAMPGY